MNFQVITPNHPFRGQLYLSFDYDTDHHLDHYTYNSSKLSVHFFLAEYTVSILIGMISDTDVMNTWKTSLVLVVILS